MDNLIVAIPFDHLLFLFSRTLVFVTQAEHYSVRNVTSFLQLLFFISLSFAITSTGSVSPVAF